LSNCYKNTTFDQIREEDGTFESEKKYRMMIQKTQTIAIVLRDGYKVSQEKGKRFIVPLYFV
jgi:hypothetical protein